MLEHPPVFPGILGLPLFVGVDAGQEAGLLGRSYFSTNGGASFARITGFNLMMRLVWTAPPEDHHGDDDDDDGGHHGGDDDD